MSLSKTFLLAGAAAFVSSAALAGGIPLRASDVVGFTGVPAHKEVAASKEPRAALCGTVFGSELSTPNGVIAWNNLSTYNNASGTDFTCAVKTKVKQVWVYGYDAPHNPELYNVTFYKSEKAKGSDLAEADDSKVVCSYTALSGAGGGTYPTRVLTKLKLTTPCKFKPGHYWVSVQNNDATGPWYHEMTSTLQGTQADWIDVPNTYGSGCTTFDNNEYLSNCLGYTYPDWMLELH
jgi:hypothetical protein